MAREMTPQERAAIYTYHKVFDGYNFLSGPKGMEEIVTHDMELVSLEDHEDALQETRRAALLEVSRRLLPNAQSAMLDAPCLWCGYNGEGYWQPTTHELTCPWHNVGGRFDRVVALDRLAQEG